MHKQLATQCLGSTKQVHLHRLCEVRVLLVVVCLPSYHSNVFTVKHPSTAFQNAVRAIAHWGKSALHQSGYISLELK